MPTPVTVPNARLTATVFVYADSSSVFAPPPPIKDPDNVPAAANTKPFVDEPPVRLPNPEKLVAATKPEFAPVM